MNTRPDRGDDDRQQDRVVLRAVQGEGVEEGRQAEQAERQQAGQQMQVRVAQRHRDHDRDLARDHGVAARIVEVEKVLLPDDMHQEVRAIDEQATGSPAMPECQRPDQCDGRPICRGPGNHAAAWASTGPIRGRQAERPCSVNTALLARQAMTLTWEKVDAIPGWFGAHSYALWRSLLDFQAENVRGNLFEIGVWRGRSASVLASYCRDDESLYLCDIQVDAPALSTAFEGVGAKGRNIVTICGAVQRAAGPPRSAGHAPDGALDAHRRRAYRLGGL